MEGSIRIKFGKNVRKYRIQCGYTQEKLAEVIGVDYKYLQRIEGKNPPNVRLETVAKFAKALKTIPVSLL